MEEGSPLAVVRAWHEALDRRDAQGVLALSDAEIEIVGPRGSGFGHALLRDWLDHARVSLRPLRAFARGGAVVVAQHGVWRSPESGEVIGEAGVASAFRVAGGRVVRYARHDTLEAALADAGLTTDDETNPGA